jgi:hypothetical protein
MHVPHLARSGTTATPLPSASEDEVLVEVRAAGLTRGCGMTGQPYAALPGSG